MATGMPRPSSVTSTPPSLMDPDVDRARIAGHRLIDGVVHHLLDKVVQPTFTGGPDIHAWAFADGL